jgi:hypothetical protein
MGVRKLPVLGNVYCIPLLGEQQFGSCLLAAIKKDPLEAGFVRVYGTITAAEQIPPITIDPIAELFCTLDLIRRRIWSLAGKVEAPIDMLYDFELFTSHSILPCTIYGSANIASLIEAFNGLRPWDEMADPNYYTKMLLDDVVPKSCSVVKHLPS